MYEIIVFFYFKEFESESESEEEEDEEEFFVFLVVREERLFLIEIEVVYRFIIIVRKNRGYL